MVQKKRMRTNNIQNNWTKKEESILRRTYTVLGKRKIISLLPNRTWNAICTKASKKFCLFRGRHNAWSNEEDKILLEKYGLAEKKDILNSLPKRTWVGIESRASKVLHIFRKNSRGWTDSEIDILKENYRNREEIIGKLITREKTK